MTRALQTFLLGFAVTLPALAQHVPPAIIQIYRDPIRPGAAAGFTRVERRSRLCPDPCYLVDVTTACTRRQTPAKGLSRSSAMDEMRGFLRHTVATLAYRGGKTLRDAPVEFPAFRPQEGTRSPVEILAHIGDLLEWSLTMAQGQTAWPDHPPLAWDQEVDRFFAELQRLDEHLASEAPLGVKPKQIFQGPIADALTHVGQLAMLRRMAGGPVRGENYFKADIVAGRVGAEQSSTRVEFD